MGYGSRTAKNKGSNVVYPMPVASTPRSQNPFL